MGAKIIPHMLEPTGNPTWECVPNFLFIIKSEDRFSIS